jgi:hypothetical protein
MAKEKVQQLDNPWKFDEAHEIRYVVVGEHVVIAQNLVTRRGRVKRPNGFVEETVWVPSGDIYINFYAEREFSDGSVSLSEEDTVSGGLSVSEAKQLAEQIDRAIKLIQSGEVQ